MKTYFTLWVSVVCIMAAGTVQGQILNPKKKAKEATENRVNNRAGQGIERGLDKVEEGIGGIFKKKKKKSKRNNESTEDNGSTGSNETSVNRGSDFVPGATVIFSDNFSQDAIGDFPAQWNTSGSGEVVTLNGTKGKWLAVMHNSVINPVLDKAIPENATIEFDLFLKTTGSQSTPFIQFGLTPVRDILKENIFYSNRFFINLNRYSERDGQTLEYGIKDDLIGNKSDFPLTKYTNKVLHVAMVINKTRIRLYLDGSKIVDLPRALNSAMRNNFFLNNNHVIPASEIPMYISNVRIASADTDARSLLIKELMDEGKTSTSDILFDVNSDVLKSESFSVVKQFGEALEQNESLRIKIIGHTDSDGTDKDNLLLSKKRAAAVKKFITENYAVSGSRIQTDGEGEGSPVASNSTTAGKSKNRRVEFVKL